MKKSGLLIGLVFITAGAVFSQATNYTYTYDFWDEANASPDAYRVSAYLLGAGLGIQDFRDPQGLYVRDNRIYVCDSGNNRIVRIEVDNNGTHTVTAVVNSVMINGVKSNFAYPMDIFETGQGVLYIADTNNNRILILDHNWNYIASIVKPKDETIDETTEFLPVKLVVDFANRLFVQALNINKGLLEFDTENNFVGYMGANKVHFNPIDYVWKMVFSTAEQRKQMSLFIPSEYNNLCIDNEGFIYVTNNSQKIAPVRRLNARGQDILVRNGYEDPQGDLSFGNAGGINGPSRFIDVTTFDNDSYGCFDRIRGRIFIYDFQGNLLYAFGGVGNRKGRFLQPVALDHMGYSLYALDSQSGAVTRFDMTSYGEKINDALSEYRAGRYDSSAGIWEDVLKMNGNYDLAYIGIGRAALRQGDYKTAMKYYELKHYKSGYSKAFQLYRKQFMEENLWKMLLALLIIIFVPMIVSKILKIRREIREE